MRPTPHMRTVLKEILVDVERLEGMPQHPEPGMDRDVWRALRLEQQELERFGVRYRLERWMGRPPSRSDSAVFSRTLRHMQDLGLLVRINRWGGRRTTHVRLTPAGERLAQDLALEEDQEPAKALDLDSLALEPIDLPEEGETR